MEKMSPEAKSALRAKCVKFLSFEAPRSAADWVAAMAASPHLELGLDNYSKGPAIAELEQRVAEMLGKEAALWFPKGVIAQQVALLVHAERAGSRSVGMPPRSHLASDEAGAVERLSGLRAIRIGSDHRPFGVVDLEKIHEPLAALTVELPLRRAGYQSVPWEDLVAISQWARERQVKFHVDGARLWETQPWYGRALHEIAGLADSIYVSLYKGLGGMSGCVLAGTAAAMEAAKPWRLRFGGDLPLGFPLVITALDGLQSKLPEMPKYYETACAFAAAIDAVPDLAVFPKAPHCNAFQVHFRASAEAMEAAALQMAEGRGIWLFGWFEQGLLPETSMGEVSIGEGSKAWTPSEVAAALKELHNKAQELSKATNPN